MKPRTQRRQHAGKDKHFPLPCLGPPHFSSEIVVVVLGVMYPSVLPQPGVATTHLDLPFPSLGSDTPRQSADVIFYDPLSSQRHGDEVSPAMKYGKKYKGTRYENRVEAQKAVARDLTMLFLAKTRMATSSQLPSHSDTTQTLLE